MANEYAGPWAPGEEPEQWETVGSVPMPTAEPEPQDGWETVGTTDVPEGDLSAPAAPTRKEEIRTTPEPTLFESLSNTVRKWVDPNDRGMRPSDIASGQIAYEAKQKGMTPGQYKTSLNPDGYPLRRVDRVLKGVGSGALGTIEGSAGFFEYITNGAVGRDLANQAKMWREDLAPDEKSDFSDSLASGVGSLATFFIPGMGVAKGASVLAKIGPRLASWAGTSTSAVLEAATEAGSAYRDALQESKDTKKADQVARRVFWANVPLILITDKLGIFGEKGKALTRGLVSAGMEGTQEGAQEIIPKLAAGKPIQWGDVLESSAVGAITGGGMGHAGSVYADNKTGKWLQDITESGQVSNLSPKVFTQAQEEADRLIRLYPDNENLQNAKAAFDAENARRSGTTADPPSDLITLTPEDFAEIKSGLDAGRITIDQIENHVQAEGAKYTPESLSELGTFLGQEKFNRDPDMRIASITDAVNQGDVDIDRIIAQKNQFLSDFGNHENIGQYTDALNNLIIEAEGKKLDRPVQTPIALGKSPIDALYSKEQRTGLKPPDMASADITGMDVIGQALREGTNVPDPLIDEYLRRGGRLPEGMTRTPSDPVFPQQQHGPREMSYQDFLESVYPTTGVSDRMAELNAQMHRSYGDELQREYDDLIKKGRIIPAPVKLEEPKEAPVRVRGKLVKPPVPGIPPRRMPSEPTKPAEPTNGSGPTETQPETTPPEPKPEEEHEFVGGYYVLANDTGKEKQHHEVKDGKSVTIPGFEEFDLFVNREPFIDTKSYNVTEGKTGLSVSSGANTQREAIQEATETLNRVGKEALAKAIKEGIEKSGLSPRYRKKGAAPSIGTITNLDTVALSKIFKALIDKGEQPKGKVMVEIVVSEALGVKRTDISRDDWEQAFKKIEEAYEYAIVQKVAEITKSNMSNDKKYSAIVDIYNNQPVLGQRTSTSRMNQQYSTPAPLAYLMTEAIGVKRDDFVADLGGAGNGMLLIGADLATAIEIDQGTRTEHLKAQGFTVINDDASKPLPKKLLKLFDKVLINPPFGSIPVRDMDGFLIKKLEHAIAIQALEGMKDDGKAAIIIGGHNFDRGMRVDGNPVMTDTDRVFLNYLYSRYNVVHNIDVDGDVYRRQGTSFPIPVIIVDGRRAQADESYGAPRAVDQVFEAKTLEDVKAILRGQRGRRTVPRLASGKDEGIQRPGETKRQRPSKPKQAPSGSDQLQPPEGRKPGSDGGKRGGDTGNEQGANPPGQRQPEGTEGEGSPELPPGELQTSPVNIFDASKKEELQKRIRDRLNKNKPTKESDSEPPKLKEPKDVPQPPAPPPTVSDKTVTDAGQSYPDSTLNNPDLTTTDKGPVKIFDESKKAELQKKIRDRLNGRFSSNPMFDPELFVDALHLGGIYLQEGTNNLLAWSERMIKDLSDNIKPFLNSIWMALHHYPEGHTFDAELMSDFYQYAGIEYESGKKTKDELDQAMTDAFGDDAVPYLDSIYNSLVALDSNDPLSEKKTPENEFQQKYEPESKGRSGNNLTPKNIAQSVKDFLKDLTQRKGDIDEFVMKALGYDDKDSFYDAFSAEQIDALAMAVDAVDKRQGIIVGDQTGVGKGRVAAGLIRYANKLGKKPIFVTADPKLFSDLYRDLVDINYDKKPFILHGNPEAAVVDSDENVIYKKGFDENVKAQMEAKDYSFMDGHDFIVTAYPQIQNMKLENTAIKAAFLSEWAKDNIVILDEAHEAAGESTRGQVMCQVLNSAAGVMYMSATYAKRPDCMGLYFRTKLGDANISVPVLIDLVTRGGVPLQQILAMQLTEGGQYVRRELDFSGITFTPEINVANKDQDMARADDITGILRDIVQFSAAMDAWATTQNTQNNPPGTPLNMRTQITTVNFASTVHNMINQLLLGLKADTVIRSAVDTLKKGEKPVITLFNTMGTFLEYVVEHTGAKKGDAIGFTFRDVCTKALNGCLKMTRKTFGGRKQTYYLTPDELPQHLFVMYKQIEALIASLKTDVPASPIDYIKHGIETIGSVELGREIKLGEITGRDWIIDYTDPKKPVLGKREEKSKNKIVNKFNRGDYDALIFNSAGATGLSIHSNPKFKDTRRRVGLVIQPDLNIDKFMQGLGRINRKGQLLPPYYIFLQTALPTELRPGVILSKKMASLNANISANSDSAVSMRDIPDMMNRYGDRIMREYLEQHQDIWHELGSPDLGAEDLFKKVSGKSALLPCALQARMFDEIEAEYKDLIEYLDTIGENDLTARDLDFRAKVLMKSKLSNGMDETNPFQRSTWLNKIEVRNAKKPYNAAKINEIVTQNLNGKTAKDFNQDILDVIEKKAGDYTTNASQEEAAHLQVQTNLFLRKIRNAINRFQIGRTFEIPIAFNAQTRQTESVIGTVVNVKYDNKETGNPAQPGRLRITFAVNDARQLMTFSAARDQIVNGSTLQDRDFLSRMWDKSLNLATTEIRYVITGNVLHAVQLATQKGHKADVVTFSMEDGTMNYGVLLPRSANRTADRDYNKKMVQWKEAYDWLASFGDSSADIETVNGNVTIEWRGKDYPARVEVPSARAKGEKYWAEQKLLDLIRNNEFAGRWTKNKFGATVEQSNLAAFMRVLGESLNEQFMVPLQASDIDITRGGEIDDNLSLKEWTPLYLERQRPHIQRLQKTFENSSRGAIRAGDITNPSVFTEKHKQIVREQKAFGHTVFFYNGYGQATNIRGFVFPEAPKTIFLNLNQATDWGLDETVKHESLHLMRMYAPKIYEELQTQVSTLVTGFSEFRSRLNAAMIASGQSVNTYDGAMEELIARFAQGAEQFEQYATDPDKVKILCDEAFRKYADHYKEVAAKPVMMLRADDSPYSFTIPYASKPAFTNAQCEEIAAEFQKKVPNSGTIKVVESPLYFPVDMMERAGGYKDGEKIFAAYDPETDTTYLVSSAFKTKQDVMFALAHEVIGHRGPLGILTRLQQKVFYKQAYEAYKDTEKGQEIIKDYNPDLTTLEGQETFAKEVIAHMAENGAKPSLWHKFVVMLKTALKRLGINMKFGDADIKALIRQSWEYGEKAAPGKTTQAEASPPSFKKESRPSIVSIIEKSDKIKEPFESSKEIPDPATATQEEVEEYLEKEHGAMYRTLAQFLPSNLPHNTFIENLLKSPEYWEHPKLKKIVRIFSLDREKAYHLNVLHLDTVGDQSVIDETVKLKKKNEKAYKELLFAIDYLDTQWKRGDGVMKRLRDPNITDDAREAVVQNSFEKAITYLKEKRGVSDEAIRVLRLHRESYDKALDMMTAQLKEIIAKMEEKGEQNPTGNVLKDLKYALAQMQEWRGFYAPRLRDREAWAVQAERKVGDKTEYYRKHKSALTKEFEVERLKKEGWQNVRATEIAKLPESVYMNLKAVDVAKAIKEAAKGMTGDTALAFNDELLEHVADIIKARGFRSTMIHREEGKVVKGYEEDPLKRLVTYMTNLSGGFSKADAAKASMDELMQIDPAREGRTYQTAEKYITEQLRNLDYSDRLIGLAKSLATFKYLGFNPRSLAVNVTALLTTVPAAIHSIAMEGKGSMTKALSEIAKASTVCSKVVAATVGSREHFEKTINAMDSLKDDEKDFIKRIHREGYDNPQYTQDAMGQIGNAPTRVWSKTMQAAMWAFGKTEQWNRMSTMLAAYRIARARGQSTEQAHETALQTSNGAHGLYGRATLPAIAQGRNPAAKVVQMMYAYGKFGHNYLQLMYDMGFRQKDVKAFVWGLAAPLVLAGGSAWPLKEIWVGLINAILRIFGYKGDVEKWVYDSIRARFGKTGEIAARHGVTGLAGVDISGSLSIGVGIPTNLKELTGAPGGVWDDVAKAWHYAETGQTAKMFEKALPTSAANISKAVRERREGITTEKGNRVWGDNGRPLKPGIGQSVGRGFGFRSSEQALVQERSWEAKEIEKRYTDEKKDIYEAYRAYQADKASGSFAEIYRKVREFNQGLKDAGIPRDEVPPITVQSLNRQAGRMARPTKQERARLR